MVLVFQDKVRIFAFQQGLSCTAKSLSRKDRLAFVAFKLVQSVLLEVWDQAALILPQRHFLHELGDSKKLEELEEIGLLS